MLTHIPAVPAEIEVIKQAQPEKFILELTRKQITFLAMICGELYSRHSEIDPIGSDLYCKLKNQIGFDYAPGRDLTVEAIADFALANIAEKNIQ
jgi:hypothetical protein